MAQYCFPSSLKSNLQIPTVLCCESKTVSTGKSLALHNLPNPTTNQLQRPIETPPVPGLFLKTPPLWYWPYCSFAHIQMYTISQPGAGPCPSTSMCIAQVYCCLSLFSILEPPVWKTASRLHQERSATSTEGLLFTSVSTETQPQYTGTGENSFPLPRLHSFTVSVSYFSLEINFCIFFSSLHFNRGFTCKAPMHQCTVCTLIDS